MARRPPKRSCSSSSRSSRSVARRPRCAIREHPAHEIACVDALASQFYEWNPWLFGYLDEIPKEPAGRLGWARKRYGARFATTADRFRKELVARLGDEKGRAVKYAEAFEVCEYGSQPSQEQLLKLFPFFP